ncbi:PREDICTED: N-alpha-acetyltransferase 25, NatB auxiliary subunit-like [Amphimedon queenslandica]|uniref:N-terminal acetyltransferase B complex subunit NAA25 homolog n=1 Tax=Amphimedon queenslandica TaxID=400682 RepID=A0AAN0J9H7_AMPQE|nr:PREDICTED: N-alpha-acetyltransferase 25, NatB auxiliary subunit-like [Amphimedon queenslandica]|eukprot:XP_019853381.1 PREDICTED: N-alpha-acetyltransferase 25, NatB auxiliary subunit-like [Amphimedon queenslandica]
MASSTQEAEAIERKLRPVYDALDNAQHKKVMQMVDKILKKSPNLHCAKALKAIALLRLGRGDEGTKLINSVIECRPGDNATLQAVFMYCRELGDYKKIVELYESAVKSYPTNEEFLTQLFMAYVRVGDCAKQQQIAVQLSKHYPQNGPYYCWRIMSIMMQAHEADDSIAKQMFLPLAERLMEKYIEEKRIESEAEIRLYISVLQSLDKNEKILRILKNELGEKLRHPEEVLRYELQCLESLGQWSQLVSRLVPAIKEQPDNWGHLKLYITSQVHRLKTENEALNDTEVESEKGEGQGVESPLDEMVSVLNELVSAEDEKKSKRLRGPYLSVLEAVRQLKEAAMPFDKFPDLATLLEQYFKLFSSKSCCFDDTSTYTSLLSSEELRELLLKLEAWCNADLTNFTCEDEDISANVSKLYRDISLFKLQRFSGHHSSLSLSEKRSLVKKCYQLFEAGLRFGLSLSATVSQHSDSYVIIGAHLMLQIFNETGDYADLWECVLMLKAANQQSSSNPQILLLLMKLYGWLGAIDQCTQSYNRLSIKYIQVDSIGYTAHRFISSLGAFGFAGQMYRTAIRFYVNCSKETSDYITNSYKNGVFHRVIEITKLKDRFSRSHEFYILGVESMLYEYLKSVSSMESARGFLLGEKYTESLPFTVENLDVLCDGLRDNRDMTVYDDWSPLQDHLTKREIELSFQVEVFWIKIRLAMMTLLKDMLGGVTTPSLPDQLKGVLSLLEQVEAHEGVEFFRQRKTSLVNIRSPPTSQLIPFITTGHSLILLNFIKIGMSVLATPTGSPPPSLSEECSSIQAILKDLRDMIQGLPSDTDATTFSSPEVLLTWKLDFDQIVLLILTASWVTLITGMCLEYITPKKSAKKKKKKGGGGGGGGATAGSNGESNKATISLLELLEDLKSSLLSIAKRFTPITESETLAGALAKLNVKDDPKVGENDLGIDQETYARVRTSMTHEVIESYNYSFGDIQEMVGLRVSFIKTLISSYSVNSHPLPQSASSD